MLYPHAETVCVNWEYPSLLLYNNKIDIYIFSLTTIPDPNPSILTANIYALSEAFYDTKLQLTPKQEIYALFIKEEV